MNQQRQLGRLVLTPILTMVAGYLVGGLLGLAVGAAIGILYVMVASTRR